MLTEISRHDVTEYLSRVFLSICLLPVFVIPPQAAWSAVSTSGSPAKSESSIYVSGNNLADGLDYLAALARYTPTRRANGRQRTASGATVDRAVVRQSTSSLAAQICTPVCDKVSVVRSCRSVILIMFCPDDLKQRYE